MFLALSFFFSVLILGVGIYERYHDAAAMAGIEAAFQPVKREEQSWDALASAYPGLTAWLEIPGLLSLPIAQGTDNVFYLTHRLDGKRSKAGMPFLDYRNTMHDNSLFIYGHNMKNREVFSLLTQYARADFRQAHPGLKLYTPTGSRFYEIIAAFCEDVGKKDFWDYTVYAGQLDAETMAGYGEEMRPRLLYGEAAVAGEEILSLSTCIGGYAEGRLVLVAKWQADEAAD